MAPVDGGDKGRFDGAEGGHVEIFDKFEFGGVIAKDAISLDWMGTC